MDYVATTIRIYMLKQGAIRGGQATPNGGISKAHGKERAGSTGGFMKPGDVLKTIGAIRSQRTGLILPREGQFVGAIENLGRTLFRVHFAGAGDEYVFPHEVLPEAVREATTHG
jgi:hypothetical protein